MPPREEVCLIQLKCELPVLPEFPFPTVKRTVSTSNQYVQFSLGATFMLNMFRQKLNTPQTIVVIVFGVAYILICIVFNNSISESVGYILSAFWLICLAILVQIFQTPEPGSYQKKGPGHIQFLVDKTVSTIAVLILPIIINYIIYRQTPFSNDMVKHGLFTAMFIRLLISNLIIVTILTPIYVWWRLRAHKKTRQ